MGTAIIAVLAVRLPHALPGAHDLAVAVWLLSSAMFVVVAALAVRALAGGALRRWTHDPHVAPFLGTSAMAAVTVAGATLAVGADHIGATAALVVAWILWSAAAVVAVVVAVRMPVLAARRLALRADPGHPTWVLIAVPPLTVATVGTALLPHVGAGAPRTIFALVVLALLLLGIGGAARALASVAGGLRAGGRGSARGEPTLWLVLGPCGQIAAASVLLAIAVHGMLAPPWAAAADDAARVVGLVSLTAGLVWLALVLVLTARVVLRGGLPFSLAWWGFTFPVATCALGAIELHRIGGTPVPAGLGEGLFLLLLAGWCLAAGGTAVAGLRLAAARARRAEPSAAAGTA
jgi:tellurite resistance protein TehA-like permease